VARKPPVYFFSLNHQQSAYWANQLGFRPGEWRHIGEEFHGFNDAVVYLTGTYYERRDYFTFLNYMAAVGIELIIADDMVPRG